MNALLLAAALALPLCAQTEQSGHPDQTVQDQAGQLKSQPWENTGGDAGTARGAPKQPREIEATGMIGVVVIGAGLFALSERRRLRHFDNPGGTEHPSGDKSLR